MDVGVMATGLCQRHTLFSGHQGMWVPWQQVLDSDTPSFFISRYVGVMETSLSQ